MKWSIHRICIFLIAFFTSISCFKDDLQYVKAIADPDADTSGINIVLQDADGSPVEGAVFKLAREATEEELLSNRVEQEKLTYAEKKYTVVYVWFCTSSEPRSETVTETVTDEEGKAVFNGLPYGTYFLVEIKSPKEYEVLAAPTCVTVNKYSQLTPSDHVLDDAGKIIDNTIYLTCLKSTSPQTSDEGRNLVTVSGLLMIGSSLAILAVNNKRKNS